MCQGRPVAAVSRHDCALISTKCCDFLIGCSPKTHMSEFAAKISRAILSRMASPQREWPRLGGVIHTWHAAIIGASSFLLGILGEAARLPVMVRQSRLIADDLI